jgi:hypothetical protein
MSPIRTAHALPRCVLPALGAVALVCAATAAQATGARPLAPYAPLQTPIPVVAQPFQKHDYRIYPLAAFALEARVLARHDYDDDAADLAPVDLALGWGRMSDTRVLDRIAITLSDRWWRWYSPSVPIPIEEINRSAANMHLVPANDAVRRQLEAVRAGHVVTLAGYLVEARRPGGWSWRSSLTRGDVGAGSCELIWVERLSVR